jgi:hypothetical protein
MANIKKTIQQNGELSDGEIMEVFSRIGHDGNIIIFKNDGIRQLDKFTVLITSPHGIFESIRYDSDTLNSAIVKALKDYFTFNP